MYRWLEINCSDCQLVTSILPACETCKGLFRLGSWLTLLYAPVLQSCGTVRVSRVPKAPEAHKGLGFNTGKPKSYYVFVPRAFTMASSGPQARQWKQPNIPSTDPCAKWRWTAVMPLVQPVIVPCSSVAFHQEHAKLSRSTNMSASSCHRPWPRYDHHEVGLIALLRYQQQWHTSASISMLLPPDRSAFGRL